MDVQGEELRVIRDARADIREMVSHIVIGTHSSRVHSQIRAILQEDGWGIRFDYPGKSHHQTEFGNILFTDGLLAADRPDA
jgi:hypothetical protein